MFNAFAFLETEPEFMCQLNPPSTDWTYGTYDQNLQKEFCGE